MGDLSAGQAPAANNVALQVISVLATGRGGQPNFDHQIPKALREQLEQSNFAYTKYSFVGTQRQTTPFTQQASFPLPDSESLGVAPFPSNSRTHPVRLDMRILDKDKNPIMTLQVRVSYGSIFLLHRPKSGSALIVGVSALQPK